MLSDMNYQAEVYDNEVGTGHNCVLLDMPLREEKSLR